MKLIRDIRELKQGDQIVKLSKGSATYYEFLMIHPHKPYHIICLDCFNDVKTLFVPSNCEFLFTEVSDKDAVKYRRDYFLTTVEILNQKLKETE